MSGELQVSIHRGDLPRVRLLVQGGATITGPSEKYSALNLAALCGKTPIVEWLLAKGGANIFEVDEHGYTALL
jgi:ankyrin repeat protein